MRFAVFLGETDTGYCAHSPDVPGVAATGATVEETIASYREALGVLFELIRKEGGELPVARTIAATVEVDDVA